MSALALRVLACVTMLADHIGYCFGFPGLRLVGRISFPIFVFLIYNGYRHTHHRLRYGLRLALFALISQIPFGLMSGDSLWYRSGNVMVSLLIAFLCIWLTDTLYRRAKWLCVLPTMAVFCLYFFGLVRSDYGFKATVMAMLFLLLWDKGLWGKLLMFPGVAVASFWPYLQSLALFLLRGGTPPTLSTWEKQQIFAVFSVLFLCLYNGKKGNVRNKWVQYGFYAFYPVHMLLLWAISKFL